MLTRSKELEGTVYLSPAWRKPVHAAWTHVERHPRRRKPADSTVAKAPLSREQALREALTEVWDRVYIRSLDPGRLEIEDDSNA